MTNDSIPQIICHEGIYPRQKMLEYKSESDHKTDLSVRFAFLFFFRFFLQ